MTAAGLPTTVDVAVIGGGIAGLTVAWELARAGRRVVVCEAGAVVGGMLRGGRVAGVDVDLGAESFATRTSGVADLVADAALPVDLVEPRPGGAQLVVPNADAGDAGGADPGAGAADDATGVSRHPLPQRAMLGLPADPAAADVARIIGAAGVARARQERDLPLPAALAGDLAHEPSLAELATTRYGAAVAERLVEPLCRSVHSRPAAALRLSAVAPNLWAEFLARGSLTDAVAALAPAQRAGAAVGGIAGGMWRLAAALRAAAEAAGAVIRPGTPVRAIETGPAGAVLMLGDGQITAGEVVVATGPAAAGRLLGVDVSADPVRLVTAAVVHPALDSHPVGSGVIVAPGVPTAAKALTHANAKWPWLATVLPAGHHVIRLSARDAAGLRNREEVAAALHLLTGAPVTPADIRSLVETRWDDAVPAAGTAPPDALAAAAATRGIRLAGAVAAGTGLASVIPHARALARDLIGTSSPQPEGAPHV